MNTLRQKMAGWRPTRKTTKIILASGVAVLVLGLVFSLIFLMGGDDNKKATTWVSPTASASPTGTPTTTASPSSASPTPSPTTNDEEGTGSQATVPAPTVTKTTTVKPSAKPVKPAPKCEVPVIKPAPSDSAHKGKEAVKALLRQNMAWDVYGGKFNFPYEHPSQETMVDLYKRVDSDGPQRAGLDLAGLYWNSSNWSKIRSHLKAVTGPCAKLAKVDLAYGEGVQSLYSEWNRASTSAQRAAVMNDLNAAAEWYLYHRNKVLLGQVS